MATKQVSVVFFSRKLKNISYIFSPFIKQKFGSLTDASAIVNKIFIF
jgi:hypothetical protein